MRIVKLNNTMPKQQKPLQKIKQKKEYLQQMCEEMRHKKIKDLSTKELPLFGYVVGFFTPIPLGCVIGLVVGKLAEIGINIFKKKS